MTVTHDHRMAAAFTPSLARETRQANCLGGKDVTGRFQDGPAANGIFVQFYRASREQIDRAAEQRLDLFVKIKKVPADMHARLKRDQKVDVATRAAFTPRQGAGHLQSRDAVAPAKWRQPGLDLVQRRPKRTFRSDHGRLPIYKIAQ